MHLLAQPTNHTKSPSPSVIFFSFSLHSLTSFFLRPSGCRDLRQPDGRTTRASEMNALQHNLPEATREKYPRVVGGSHVDDDSSSAAWGEEVQGLDTTCYHADGEEAHGFRACGRRPRSGPGRGASPCCPGGYACSVDDDDDDYEEAALSCVVVIDPRATMSAGHDIAGEQQERAVAKVVACTDPAWDGDICGAMMPAIIPIRGGVGYRRLRDGAVSAKTKDDDARVDDDAQTQGGEGAGVGCSDDDNEDTSAAVQAPRTRGLRGRRRKREALTLGPVIQLTIPEPRPTTEQRRTIESSSLRSTTIERDAPQPSSSSSSPSSSASSTTGSTTSSPPSETPSNIYLYPSSSSLPTTTPSSPTLQSHNPTQTQTIPTPTHTHHTLTGIETVVPTYPPSTTNTNTPSSHLRLPTSQTTKLGLGLGTPFLVLLVLALVACLHRHQRRRRRRRALALAQHAAPPFDFDAPEMVPVSVADFAHLRLRQRPQPQPQPRRRYTGDNERRSLPPSPLTQRSNSWYRNMWQQSATYDFAPATAAPLVPRRSSARLLSSNSRRRRLDHHHHQQHHNHNHQKSSHDLVHSGLLGSHPPQVPPLPRVSWSQGRDSRRHDGGRGYAEELGALYSSYFDDDHHQDASYDDHGPWSPGLQDDRGNHTVLVPPAVRMRGSHQQRYLSLDVNNRGPGGIDEVSPLSSSGSPSAHCAPGRISAMSGLDGLSPRPM